LFGSSSYGLIFGNIFGLFGRFGIQAAASFDATKSVFRRFDLRSMRAIGRQYADFPKLNAPAGFIFSLGQNLPVLLFGVMFSPAVAGFYAMAHRLSQVPVKIVAMSTRRVFLQKAAAVNKRGNSLRKAYVLTSGGLALLGVLPFGLLWLYGQPLLSLILGERWFDAGRYVEIMAPWLFMLLVVSPSPSVFVVLRKQNYWLITQIVMTCLRLSAFGLAFLLASSAEWTLKAFVVATVCGNLGTIGLVLFLISRHDSSSQVADTTQAEGGRGNE
jgi:O-antigen/teichoic acid export membrane protein